MLHAPHIQNKHAKLNEIYVDSIHSTHMCATEISTQNTQSKCDSIPNLVLFWWFSTTWKNSTVKIIKRNIKMCLFVFSAQLAEYTLKMRTVTYLDSWIFTQQMLDDQSRDIIWCDTLKEWFTFFSPFNYHFALSIIVVRTELILFWLFEYTNRFSSVNHTNSIKTGLLRFEQDIFGQKCNRQGGESVLKIQKSLTNTEIFQYLSVPISIC